MRAGGENDEIPIFFSSRCIPMGSDKDNKISLAAVKMENRFRLKYFSLKLESVSVDLNEISFVSNYRISHPRPQRREVVEKVLF